MNFTLNKTRAPPVLALALGVGYLQARSASDLTFDSVAGMVFAVIAAAIAATISMNAFERRREVATLRALGMHSTGVFFMFAAEALWMAAFAVVISLVGSGLIAWVVNRAALSYSTQQALKQAPMLVELDFQGLGDFGPVLVRGRTGAHHRRRREAERTYPRYAGRTAFG